jgi:hypothetical protein
MVTKKSAATKAKVRTVLRIEQIVDPGPDGWNINRAAVARINQLKKEFVNKVNAAVAKGQK